MRIFRREYNGEASALPEIPLEEIDFRNGTLICCPGQYAIGRLIKEKVDTEADIYQREMFGKPTNSNRVTEGDVSGFVKISERMLGGKGIIDSGFQLVSLSYTDTSNNEVTSGHRIKYNLDPENYCSEDAKKFALKVIMPLIADNTKLAIKHKDSLPLIYLKGQPKPEEEIIKNLSKVNFFAFSYGGLFASEVCNATKKYMQDLGFENHKIKELLGNIDLLAVGSSINTSVPDALLFRTVLFQARNDDLMIHHTPNFLSEEQNTKRAPFLIKAQNNIIRVIIDVPDKIEYTTYRLPQPTKTVEDKMKHHELRLYLSYRVKANGAETSDNISAAMIENCLNNMAGDHRGDKPNRFPEITDLLSYSDTLHDHGRDRHTRIIHERRILELVNELNNNSSVHR